MSETRQNGEVPAIAGVIDRPRLNRVLESPLVRICVVQGPSGSGKTTLVRGWAHGHGPGQGPLIWVSLNRGMPGRKAFWEHVSSSAARLGELSPEASAEAGRQLALASDPVRLAGELLADAGSVTLVLDAYEHLGDAIEEIDEDLAALAAAVPQLRIVITSRAPTRLTELVLDGGDMVRVIGLAELALTSDEVQALILSQTGMDDPRLAASLARATRGFALAVRAAVLTLSQLGRIPRVDSPEWNEAVTARLESLLPDAESVRFVTDTSVPPYVDGELGRSLSGNPETERLFGMLERNGFGRWIPYTPERQVFQYVETIRDAFRARAAQDTVRFRRSCVITAGWLLENEEVVDQALQFAIDGGDYALADRIFVPLVIGNPDSYITDRFLPALQRVPEDELEQQPMLAFGLALALAGNPVRRGEAPRIAEIAVRAVAGHSYVEPTIDAFSLAAMRAIAQRLALRFRDSGTAGLEVVRAAEAMPTELVPPFAEQIATILRQLSYSLFQGGRIDAALPVIDRSIALCPTPITRDYSTVYAAGFSAFAGDLPRAKMLAASIDTDAWPEEFRHSFMNGLGLVAEGHRRLDALDFTGAAEVLRGAESYIHTAEFWPFLTGISVVARHGTGQALAEAHRVIRELDASVPPPGIGDNVATERLYAALALAMLAGHDQQGATWLLAGTPRDSPHLAGARIALALAAGRDRDAVNAAERLIQLPDHTIRSRAEAQTFGAVAALRAGTQETAWAWVGAAALAWEASGPRVHIALLAPQDRRALVEFAHERGSVSVGSFLDASVPGGQASTLAAELTRRERIVLAALAQHRSAADIAGMLVVSPNTVKSQLRSIYRKLGVSSRRAALAVAQELGLLDPPRSQG